MPGAGAHHRDPRRAAVSPPRARGGQGRAGDPGADPPVDPCAPRGTRPEPLPDGSALRVVRARRPAGPGPGRAGSGHLRGADRAGRGSGAVLGGSAPTPAEAQAPPAAGLPERGDRAAAALSAGERPEPRAAGTGDPAGRMAAWMVQRYGRLDAETRTAAAAAFYGPGDPSGAYWRAVLAHIRGR